MKEGEVMLEIERIFNGIAETLQRSVLPELQTGFARGQLWSVIEVIDNMAARVDWGGQQLEFENDGLTKLAAELAPMLDAGPLRDRVAAFATGGATSVARSHEGRSLICELIETGLADDGPIRTAVDGFLANDAFLRGLAMKPSRLSEISQS
ncbi:MAG: hypothetical protein ACI8TX_001954 [Hyphomicrobiaceae bacterium]